MLAKFNNIEKSRSTRSSANWQYDQTGYTYNLAGLEYGGADTYQGPYPEMLSVTDQYGPYFDTITDQYGPAQMEVIIE